MRLTQIKRRAEAIKVEGEHFERLDLRSMKAFGSSWKDCIFTDCDFDLADIRASKFDSCEFVRCPMRLVNLQTGFFETVSFVECDLEQASFMGSQFRNVSFEDCRLAYGETMFQDVTAKGGVIFRGSNLHGSSVDFREADQGAVSFERCNLWGARLSLGCAFWNGAFDDRLVRQFLALVARVSEDSRIAALAGDQYAVVCRAMDGDKVCRDSTTSQATTSTPILSFPDQTDTTVTVTTTPTATTRTSP